LKANDETLDYKTAMVQQIASKNHSFNPTILQIVKLFFKLARYFNMNVRWTNIGNHQTTSTRNNKRLGKFSKSVQLFRWIIMEAHS
jgi:hypothetical protein